MLNKKESKKFINDNRDILSSIPNINNMSSNLDLPTPIGYAENLNNFLADLKETGVTNVFTTELADTATSMNYSLSKALKSNGKAYTLQIYPTVNIPTDFILDSGSYRRSANKKGIYSFYYDRNTNIFTGENMYHCRPSNNPAIDIRYRRTIIHNYRVSGVTYPRSPEEEIWYSVIFRHLLKDTDDYRKINSSIVIPNSNYMPNTDGHIVFSKNEIRAEHINNLNAIFNKADLKVNELASIFNCIGFVNLTVKNSIYRPFPYKPIAYPVIPTLVYDFLALDVFCNNFDVLYDRLNVSELLIPSQCLRVTPDIYLSSWNADITNTGANLIYTLPNTGQNKKGELKHFPKNYKTKLRLGWQKHNVSILKNTIANDLYSACTQIIALMQILMQKFNITTIKDFKDNIGYTLDQESLKIYNSTNQNIFLLGKECLKSNNKDVNDFISNINIICQHIDLYLGYYCTLGYSVESLWNFMVGSKKKELYLPLVYKDKLIKNSTLEIILNPGLYLNIRNDADTKKTIQYVIDSLNTGLVAGTITRELALHRLTLAGELFAKGNYNTNIEVNNIINGKYDHIDIINPNKDAKFSINKELEKLLRDYNGVQDTTSLTKRELHSVLRIRHYLSSIDNELLSKGKRFKGRLGKLMYENLFNLLNNINNILILVIPSGNKAKSKLIEVRNYCYELKNLITNIQKHKLVSINTSCLTMQILDSILFELRVLINKP